MDSKLYHEIKDLGFNIYPVIENDFIGYCLDYNNVTFSIAMSKKVGVLVFPKDKTLSRFVQYTDYAYTKEYEELFKTLPKNMFKVTKQKLIQHLEYAAKLYNIRSNVFAEINKEKSKLLDLVKKYNDNPKVTVQEYKENYIIDCGCFRLKIDINNRTKEIIFLGWNVKEPVEFFDDYISSQR